MANFKSGSILILLIFQFFKVLIVLLFSSRVEVCSRVLKSKKSSQELAPNKDFSLYKEPCNKSLNCNHSNLITCQDSLCECILPESMKYLEDTGRCASLVDEACGQMIIDSLEDSLLLQCVPDAFCNTQGYCECIQGFFRNDEGICTKQKDFGTTCTLDKECLKPLGLNCVNHTCTCDPLVSIDSLKFDESQYPEHLCLGKASKPCPSGHCVPHAECKGDSKSHKVCQCQLGYEETEKGLCLGTFNKSCDIQNKNLCQKDFICLDGICQCSYPRDQIYNTQVKQCVSFVGGPCLHPSSMNYTYNTKNGVKGQCIDNAVCKRVTESRTLCGCDAGFVESTERTCDIAYGQPCTSFQDDKNLSDGQQDETHCDRLANLKCRDGFCLCEDVNQIFDKSKQKCVTLVGASCNRRDVDGCVEHSLCITRRGGLLPQGLCQCKDGFEETPRRTCSCKYCSTKDNDDDY